MGETMKLYLVRCTGMHGGLAADAHGVAYVVAKDPSDAYHRLRSFLDEKDFGFPQEREMKSIELVAETGAYPQCGLKLLLPSSTEG